MEISSFLNALSNLSQSVVRFLFASKWSIWIIVLIIIIYFIWKGLENAEKKNVVSTEENKESISEDST
ncbi:hypothetical protein LCGC14_2042640 [marine sediment metagenome]|uniref:Uncharacterized protein n=1 Tax=marine sediment metagenome TaxID=412755 RepID=A0A0F9H4V4_9ZZZZ